MLRTLIRHWRALFAGCNDTPNRATPVTAREAAYRPSDWFDIAWQMLAANKFDEVAQLLASAASRRCDPAERACLCAGLARMRGDLQEAQAHADKALAARADFSHAYLQRARA